MVNSWNALVAADTVVDNLMFFPWLPEWLEIFISSMIPWVEARYVIPFYLTQGWQWWQVFPIAVVGNVVPVPFILLFFVYIERFLRRYTFWDDLIERLFLHTRRRADKTIRKYETLGLLLFVAIPVPFTGAWTGSLIAYLFGLKTWKSFLTIALGVVCSASIMTMVTLLGVDLLYIIAGILVIGVGMAIFMFYGMYINKNMGEHSG